MLVSDWSSDVCSSDLFVDLLPESWTGVPPGLPQEVVDELARRAREAEKRERAQRQLSAQRTLPPVRVRVGVQPTFTRYTFGLPRSEERRVGKEGGRRR